MYNVDFLCFLLSYNGIGKLTNIHRNCPRDKSNICSIIKYPITILEPLIRVLLFDSVKYLLLSTFYISFNNPGKH